MKSLPCRVEKSAEAFHNQNLLGLGVPVVFYTVEVLFYSKMLKIRRISLIFCPKSIKYILITLFYPPNLKGFEANQNIFDRFWTKYETYPPNFEHFGIKQKTHGIENHRNAKAYQVLHFFQLCIGVMVTLA